MAKVTHYNGTLPLSGVQPLDNPVFATKFPGVKGRRCDSFSKWVGFNGGEMMPVTRTIFFKANPSLHKCDARCQSATGNTCECACRGQFHGAQA